MLDIVFREVALHDALPADEDGIHHLADEGLVGGRGALGVHDSLTELPRVAG